MNIYLSLFTRSLSVSWKYVSEVFTKEVIICNSILAGKLTIFGHGVHWQIVGISARRGPQNVLTIVIFVFGRGGFAPQTPPAGRCPCTP